MNRRVISGVLVLLCLGYGVATAEIDPANKCIRTANSAAAKELACVVKVGNAMLSGGNGDIGSCERKLQVALQRAAYRGAGACPNDFSTLVAYRAELAATDLFAALDGPMASTDEAKACVRAKSTATAKHAACMATAYGRLLAAKSADFTKCTHSLAAAFVRAESKGGCLTLGDTATAALSASSAWTNLAHGNLTGVRLDVQNLSRGDLAGINLGNASLVGSDFSEVYIQDADLRDADLTGAILEFTNLWRTDLSGANLTNAVAVGANFRYANLTDVILTGADLDGVFAVDLGGCPGALPSGWVCVNDNLLGPRALAYEADLTNATVVDLDLTEIALSDADLTGADFSGVDLQGSLLAGANLTDTALVGARLTNANLARAHLTRTDLSHADLSGASFYDGAGALLVDVVWNQTTCPDGSLSNTNGTSPESCCGHIPSAPASCSP